jgi:hypothetical protein
MPNKDAITTHLVERLAWRCARRDERRRARRVWQPPPLEAMESLAAGASLDACVPCLDEVGVLARGPAGQGEASQRERGAFFQSVLRSGMPTLWGSEAMHARPDLRCSDAAALRLGGCKAMPSRQGLWQRRPAQRQGATPPGPLGLDTVADHRVQLRLTARAACLHGGVQARAQAGGCVRPVTGRLEGTALETTAREAGGGQGTRQRQSTDQRGKGRASEGSVSGWTLRGLREARPQRPWAAQVVQRQDHAALCPRALVPPGRTKLADHACRRRRLLDRGCVAGAALGWLAQPGSGWVVPAPETMAVPPEARALAAGGAGVVARRVHPVAHGQGPPRGTARLEPAVVGLAACTTYDQDGAAEPARQRYRKDVEEPPRQAGGVRQWHKRDSGPGGQGVLLTHETVEQPLAACDASDARSLSEHCGSKASTPAWPRKPPPQQTARAVPRHVCCPRALLARATASRWQAAQAAVGDEPRGGQRWRRPLIPQNRAKVIICAQGWYGLFHVAASSLLLGVRRKEPPLEVGSRRDVLKQYGLMGHA